MAEEEEAAAATSHPRLPELLEQGWQLLDEVEATSEPTGSRLVQDKVKLGLSLLDQAARMVDQLDLFSRHEDLEEVASADLKYLLVPALRGALTLKQAAPGQRLDQVQRARGHFADFLQRCRDYGLSAAEPAGRPAGPPGARPDLVAAATHRQAKIQRYKQKKEAESQLAALKEAVAAGRADEEQVRAYYLLHVQKWVGASLDEMESIDQEAEILRGRDQAGQQASTSHPPRPGRPPMRPFVLTRDAAQAKVFGLGYPSLATMTVNEWYDQHEKWGALPDQGVPRAPAGAAKEDDRDREKEEEEEEESESSLRKARGWDEWKDTNPRGYGNRQNMG
ncbi:immunoglobulin-binding protein 1 [Tachyglossus aculeatus]|uniref:immunoglobulin-binding protein 1 n=1 Tax=Tachyglossus aculeatus TaxID=9261 RepID=UPI0018F5894C|nr:immunoglobulin-binding protein 1 [Tachyglossus aculeatus]